MSKSRRPEDEEDPSRSSGSESWPVVVLDADPERRGRVAATLRDCAGEIRVVARGEAVPAIETDSAIIVVGLGSQADDVRLIRALREQGADVIAYGPAWSGAGIGARCEVLLTGASCLLDSGEPDFDRQLHTRVLALLRARRQTRAERHELSALMARLGIVGRSAVMQALFRWIVRVGVLSDLPVLIAGESGTGKELVARAIHRLDVKRRDGPFVPLNCGALSPGLAESELFGHKRGAFTGAAGDRPGLFRAADRGVLFLDEIGDLATALQGKLLRALQENRILGVGEDREVSINVRVIAATNRDLQRMVDEDRFRLDLYHRLSVLVARVPPLAERREDIGSLVEHFLRKHGPLGNGNVSARTDFVAALTTLDLPGNVRQLENLVCRALVHGNEQGLLDLEDLPPEVWQQLCRREAGGEAGKAATPLSSSDWTAILDAHRWSLSSSLQACEKALLQAALRRSQGNQSKTARLLGVTPRSIYNKVRRHHLDS